MDAANCCPSVTTRRFPTKADRRDFLERVFLDSEWLRNATEVSCVYTWSLSIRFAASNTKADWPVSTELEEDGVWWRIFSGSVTDRKSEN